MTTPPESTGTDVRMTQDDDRILDVQLVLQDDADLDAIVEGMGDPQRPSSGNRSRSRELAGRH